MGRIETAVADVAPAPARLSDIVASIAAQPAAWMDRVRLRTDRRWYERLRSGPDYDVWLISWLPDQGTGFHDHGASSGAFAVASGVLEEQRPGEPATLVHVGEVRTFGHSYAHDVRNPSSAPAISIHAYSPPLTEMTRYELEGTALVPRQDDETPDEGWRDPDAASVAVSPRGIDGLLAAARDRLHRLSPAEAYAAVVTSDACLVDIRPAAQRAVEGAIPDALVIERNVLEWRFDPASEARLAFATGYDVQVVVICSEGYTSSLAAAALQEIGLWRATDVIGGFHAWRAAGLPTSAERGIADPAPSPHGDPRHADRAVDGV